MSARLILFLAAPLYLETQHVKDKALRKYKLLPDLLAIHLIRSPTIPTMISYHPFTSSMNPDIQTTSAKRLNTRFLLVGKSIYWQHVLRDAHDPTLLLVAMLWHPIYAWDEALEKLYEHIALLVSCTDLHVSSPHAVSGSASCTKPRHEFKQGNAHYSITSARMCLCFCMFHI